MRQNAREVGVADSDGGHRYLAELNRSADGTTPESFYSRIGTHVTNPSSIGCAHPQS
jgi:hypothetical protein